MTGMCFLKVVFDNVGVSDNPTAFLVVCKDAPRPVTHQDRSVESFRQYVDPAGASRSRRVVRRVAFAPNDHKEERTLWEISPSAPIAPI